MPCASSCRRRYSASKTPVADFAATNAREEGRQRNVQFVNKGSNPWTEHYSAVQAEVPDPADAGTLARVWPNCG